MYYSFLILRPIILAVFTLFYGLIVMKKSILMQNPNSVKDSSGTLTFMQKNNFKLGQAILYVICYPVIMYTGAVRLIKHEHYIISLKNNHLIELLG